MGGGSQGYWGRESKLKFQPGHPREGIFKGVHVLRSILMAIAIFYFTFRPILNLPKIPSGINCKLRPKKGQVLVFSPKVVGCQIFHHYPTTTDLRVLRFSNHPPKKTILKKLNAMIYPNLYRQPKLILTSLIKAETSALRLSGRRRKGIRLSCN